MGTSLIVQNSPHGSVAADGLILAFVAIDYYFEGDHIDSHVQNIKKEITEALHSVNFGAMVDEYI